MRAKFIGDPRHGGEGPAAITLYGVAFPKGEWVEPIPAALEAKLPGNSHFETAASGDFLRPAPTPEQFRDVIYKAFQESAAADPSAEPHATLDASAPAAFAAFDPDGDGRPGGSTASPEKDALIAQLDAIGATFDRRWGPARLKAALEVAQFERGDA